MWHWMTSRKSVSRRRSDPSTPAMSLSTVSYCGVIRVPIKAGPTDLARHDEPLPTPLHRLTEQLLGVAPAVHVGSIEERDTCVECDLDRVQRRLVLGRPPLAAGHRPQPEPNVCHPYSRRLAQGVEDHRRLGVTHGVELLSPATVRQPDRPGRRSPVHARPMATPASPQHPSHFDLEGAIASVLE